MLVASLHQGIADLIPTRLEFYEHWLHPSGMRHGEIGLAPLAAVLSFLRQEGEPYDLVTERAGQYAAQWTFDNLPPLQRSLIRALPAALRIRLALHLTKRLVRRTFAGGRASSTMRRGQTTITMRSSIFCTVREPFPRPLCGYYAAALGRTLALMGVTSAVQVRACRGCGASACVIAVTAAPGQSR